MTTRKTPEEVRDFALYGFRALQDVAYSAFENSDPVTLKTVLDELLGSFRSFERKSERDHLPILKRRVEHSAGKERIEAQALYSRAERTQKVALSLNMARDEVFFGLASRAVELAVSAPSEIRREMAQTLTSYLPKHLTRLTEVFDSVNKSRTSDFWGWRWLDVVPDGRVHSVDTHSRPNRLYCIRALQLLDTDPGMAIAVNAIPKSDDLIYLFEGTNNQSIPAMARHIRDKKDAYLQVLTEPQIERIDTLLALVDAARLNLEAIREEGLAASRIDPAKLMEFRTAVVEGFKSSGRIRPLFQILSRYRDLIAEKPPESLSSSGYNQLDEKGAFVSDWHVSYLDWGEGYGRGLAQAADLHAFKTLVSAAVKNTVIGKRNLIPTIVEQIREYGFREPVVLQSLRTALEFDEIRRRELFVPAYHTDCPKTPLNELEGFIGVLKVEGLNVPVLDIFVHDPQLRNKVLIADTSSFAAWEQFDPSSGNEGTEDVVDGILIRVSDLNADELRREKLLADCPEWLKEKGNRHAQEKFLRTHVVVQVFERSRVEIADSAAPVCVTVRRTPNEDD